MLVYIYVLIDPRTEEIRYIGKTANPRQRYDAHVAPGGSQRRNTRKNNWLKNLRNAKLAPKMVLIDEVDETEWQERERWWIAYGWSRGWLLTNHTDGGFGGSFKGCHLSEEHKRKIGEANRERGKGRKLTEKHRRAISEGNKGKCLGKHLSEETRQKISKAVKIWWENLPQKKLDVYKKTLSKAQKQRWANATDEERADHAKKTSKGLLGKPLSDEHKRKIARAHKGAKNANAKLNTKDVREIRRKWATGKFMQTSLANEYKVTPPAIWCIVHRITWTHI